MEVDRSAGECREVKPTVSVAVDDVRLVLDELVKATKVVKKRKVALHSGIAFPAPPKQRSLALVIHDVSRHSLVKKMIGAIIRYGKNAKIVAITGRVDAGMVNACSVAGIEIIAVWKNPVLSGIARAKELGITIVCKVKQ